jgi:P-type Cu+ transporter
MAPEKEEVMDQHTDTERLGQEHQDGQADTRDPVCGMAVDPQEAAGTAVHDGHTYYFCSQICHECTLLG